jgi:hypothetical protein
MGLNFIGAVDRKIVFKALRIILIKTHHPTSLLHILYNSFAFCRGFIKPVEIGLIAKMHSYFLFDFSGSHTCTCYEMSLPKQIIWVKFRFA